MIELININDTPETNVDWYADGERCSAEVLNRPIKDVAAIVNTLIEDYNTYIEAGYTEAGYTEIETPVIMSPDEMINFNGSFISSEFATSENYDGVQDYVKWVISEDPEFTVIEDFYSGTEHFNSYQYIDGRELTTYYVKVRYGSDNHLSKWSDTISYTTPNVIVPIISGSSSVNEGELVTLNIVNYDATGTYNISVDAGTFSRVDSVITYVAPEVSEDTIYHMTISFTNQYNEQSADLVYSCSVINISISADDTIVVSNYEAVVSSNNEYSYV